VSGAQTLCLVFRGSEPDALKAGLWFARVEKDSTTIWAQFPGADPNERLVEINVRRTVFYPDKPGRNYITVRGFAMRHAATQWAPPTAEQVGLIGTHWSKGWVIEDNAISHSVCSGVSLGKYGDRWDNTSADTAEGYVKTIERALANGWNKETVGHHVVRNNDISHCEQTGVVGSLGAAFSTVADNTIHDIHVRRLFGGAEMAGIKFHAAIDVQIRHNTIYRTCLGLWLDWMAQGTRVTSNLFHSNGMDLFVEVDHGPFLVDNNLFLSPATLLSHSQGGAFAHNLMTGTLRINVYDARLTPFHKPHSTTVAGLHDNPNGDDRYFNNVLVGPGDLSQYDKAKLPVRMDGNVFLKGAKPSAHEANPVVLSDFDPAIRLIETPDGIDLEGTVPPEATRGRPRNLVMTKLLGKAAIPDASYEAPDGSPISLDVDHLGKPRNASNPRPGPLENLSEGRGLIRVRRGNFWVGLAARGPPGAPAWPAPGLVGPCAYPHGDRGGQG
jgi:alpha-N-arabinofuranosidase